MYDVIPAVLNTTHTTKRKNVPGCNMHCFQGKILPHISGNLREHRNTFVKPVSMVKQRELDNNYLAVNLRLRSPVNKYDHATSSLKLSAA